MGDAAARVTAAHESGRLGADAYRRIVGVLDVFADFGDPDVVDRHGTFHLTWAVGAMAVTVSVGAVGFWGVAACRGAGRMACDIGSFDDAEGRTAFGGLLMLGKALLVEEVVTAADKKLNAAVGRKKKPEPECDE